MPYVYPQECGRRADPRWVFLHDGSRPAPAAAFSSSSSSSSAGGNGNGNGNGSGNDTAARGLLIIPCAVPPAERDVTGWGWSASPFPMEELERARHQHELRADPDAVHVHVDSQSMGLGGYDSWSPNVDRAVLVNTGEYQVDENTAHTAHCT